MRAIYLDSKIEGAIKQLIKYFQEGVFDKDITEVVFKYYKKSFLFYKNELEKNGIKYKYYQNINSLDMNIYEVVFYLFNAQSNCRIASFRSAKHIFVTHGESNKISSVKPIIRIYDYVICAGYAGVDRYIQNGIFSKYDKDTNRILMLGDTFIGESSFEKTEDKKDSYILYAPTWEGGVINESYTSISSDLSSFQAIIDFAKKDSIEKVVVQAHPNTGHRVKEYKNYLKEGIKLLKNSFKEVVEIDNSVKKNSFLKIFTKKTKTINTNKIYPIYRAFIDISAMETQLLNARINTSIFVNSMKNSIVKNNLLDNYYEAIFIKDSKTIKNAENIDEIRDYYISYSFKECENMTKKQRVDWLVEFTKEKRK